MKIAILDDYHDVAKRYADWGSLGGDADVRIFNNFIPDEQVEATDRKSTRLNSSH